MMKFFRGWYLGAEIFAFITTTEINGPVEYILFVYQYGYMGQRVPLKSKAYKTLTGAIKAMYRAFPDVEWREE